MISSVLGCRHSACITQTFGREMKIFGIILGMTICIGIFLHQLAFNFFPYDNTTYERSYRDTAFFNVISHPNGPSLKKEFDSIDQYLRSQQLGYFDGALSGPRGIESFSVSTDFTKLTRQELISLLSTRNLLPEGTTH